ncbi:hypothetical protein L1987_47971 [Smallanthus sonchifolius]|uniref:Uncharacterized protein n=1 Tax=Smallanthus sonchifolius TaxID=185202 RepID=A0ACB9FSA0_9ASTR|nr:hypothetical protein L1987_47971 [Smallanthus sonchifolius]
MRVRWPLNFSPFLRFKELRSLDLSWNFIDDTIVSTGSDKVSILTKLKILNLMDNYFNGSLITSLIAHHSLETLDLSWNFLPGSIEGCKSLVRLERLESISLACNNFNKSIISCLSFLPSLKILDLSYSDNLGSSFPMEGTMSNLMHLNLDGNDFFSVDDIMSSMTAFPSLRFFSLEDCFLEGRLFANEVPKLPYLEVLLLSHNQFNGTLPMEALASFHRLKVLDLSNNNFIGSIPSTIKSLSSLKVVSFAYNKLNGSLPDHGSFFLLAGLCELKKLNELDLRDNMFVGNLPKCFKMQSSLKFFDISLNQFTGTLSPSLIDNLISLEYVDFSHNKFEGSFSFSSFSNHTKLEVIVFISDNDKFEVETEEPIGWTPMFQLEVLVLSNCKINRHKGSVIPGFLHHQHKLKKLDMSHNFLEGQLPSWLIKNNTMLEVLNLRDNSLANILCMSFYRNPNTRWLDISGNRIKGIIPKDIQKFLPYITHLNLSRNSLYGEIPSSIGDLGELEILDLSHNELSGEVPTGLFTNLVLLKLSNNSLHGEVLSGNLSSGYLRRLYLDSNFFTGTIGNKNNKMSIFPNLSLLDISNNRFTGLIPAWISNMSYLSKLAVRNNSLGGPFPCGATSLSFLDISQNHFTRTIPSCLNVKGLEHLHLGVNKFTGSIPDSFCNLTKVLTLDIGKNYLSGWIPKFIGELSNLRILLLGKNNFSGSIPKQLCQLSNASLIDLSGNSLTGTIPSCLQNITGPSYQAEMQDNLKWNYGLSSYIYRRVLDKHLSSGGDNFMITVQDEVMFTTKTLSLNYKGDVLDIMSGLDLSCNKLTGDIPEELGLLTEFRVLNLSFNHLTGTIPVNFSNLVNIESLDLSSNNLTGNVPIELIKLNYLAFFNVSYNNLSGRLPELKAQFSTFTKESYEGNPLLCGPPLEKDCMNESYVIHPSNEDRSDEKWYDIDMVSFYGGCGSTWFVFMLGFVALVYVNLHWRKRWLDFII